MFTFIKINKNKITKEITILNKKFVFERKAYKKFKKNLFSIPQFDVLRLELTNICGYNCAICTRNKMTRKQGYTSFDDLECVVLKLKKY